MEATASRSFCLRRGLQLHDQGLTSLERAGSPAGTSGPHAREPDALHTRYDSRQPQELKHQGSTLTLSYD